MREKNWPISKVDRGKVSLIGLPQRLGNGKPYAQDSNGFFPSLEEIVGENWESELLSVLVANDRLLAWWTSIRVFKQSGLKGVAADRLPKIVDIRNPPINPCVRRFLLRGDILVVLDASDKNLRNRITEWSGGDTELTPEFIWSAPTASNGWDMEVITAWCRTKVKWSDPLNLLPTHAQRLIALFDGDIYCVLPQNDADDVMTALHQLAETWNVTIISGPDEYSWMPKR